MILKLFPYVCYSVVFAFMMPLIITIPLVGPLILIPFFVPLFFYSKFFGGNFLQTGENVEIGFVLINLNSDEARFFYISFFLFVGLLITALKLVSLLVPRLNNRKSFLAMVVFFIFLIPPVLYLVPLAF